MQCPNCSYEMWDNREKNKERVAEGLKALPIYKCKNDACKHVVWPPRKPKAAPVHAAPESDQAEGMRGDERGNILKIVAGMRPEERMSLAEAQAQFERYEMDGTSHDTFKMAGRALRRIAREFDTPNANIPF